MRNLIHILFIVMLALTVVSCTPKVAESTTETVTAPPPPPAAKPMTDCETWLGKPNQSEAEDSHVLYRDAIREDF